MPFTPAQDQVLRALNAIFTAENKKLNLSAFRTEDHSWVGNILDSLSVLELMPELFGKDWDARKLKVLDIGTGGGFPLLPMALTMSSARFTGMDATRKKIDAIDRIGHQMGLQNMELVSGRFEEMAHQSEFRECFDMVTARAVAPLNTLIEYAVPFLKVRGRCVFWKSLHIADELRLSLNAAKALKAKLVHTHKYCLPLDWGERELLVFEKTHETLEIYPRRVGVPKAKPL